MVNGRVIEVNKTISPEWFNGRYRAKRKLPIAGNRVKLAIYVNPIEITPHCAIWLLLNMGSPFLLRFIWMGNPVVYQSLKIVPILWIMIIFNYGLDGGLWTSAEENPILHYFLDRLLDWPAERKRMICIKLHTLPFHLYSSIRSPTQLSCNTNILDVLLLLACSARWLLLYAELTWIFCRVLTIYTKYRSAQEEKEKSLASRNCH